ncbi:hypothetical protein ACFQPF_17530 [Fictibacillus iocasae]|uniref:DUF1129 domain-containing protein n=1 Tax=Fictibacillus iocasae TaxID=2715437 RepID=A0ABW2NUD5_9BACL
MIHLEVTSSYLKKLSKELKKHPKKRDILRDYELHLSELVEEQREKISTFDEWEQMMHERIGHPKEVALAWQEELSVTPNKTFYLFLLLNAAFFAAGALLTAVHFQSETAWVRHVWAALTSIPIIIMLVYLGFWALLGYEIGKSFGARGRVLMKKTFAFSIIPNFGLMLLVLFNIVPHEWFAPLLSETFIALCVGASFLLYPVCYAGYKWGKKQSV